MSTKPGAAVKRGIWSRLFGGRRGKTAVCLNSSFFGFFAHAGFLAGLEEIGQNPDCLSGASAGALVAGLYGAGLSPREMSGLFLQPELATVFREWNAPLRLLRLLFGRGGATGALSGEKALLLLKRYVGEKRLEDLSLPVAISVANISRNRSEVKTAGPLAEYMLASCAVPGMFQAQKVEDHHFWDGGIADPVPIDPWLKARDVRRIIVHLVDSSATPDEFSDEPRFFRALGRSHELISQEILRLKTELAHHHGKELITVVTRTPRLGPFKLKGGATNIRLGRDTALALAVD